MNTASPTTIRSQRHDEPPRTGKICYPRTSGEARAHGSAGLRRSGQ
ncbi:MAG: hypothetical protein WAL50_14805 [Kineosporiaceae bacterium]